ncbi:chitinase [Xenorhabdus sp. 42]|uniref:glycosyl hydrolase family 18 protein n=1 Tax=Xenorhabdus szentirmaii TaxID=290112 RepID=UPI001989091E|nr:MULTISPECIES: glycosyl hydrolase family 18 protein [unclassified Xenorhabdus]MBD2794013.1 chitinase [Xenorhabdus sp. CUL]MBD2803841.1 chitinase [Xenorhabdus sp. ZM]MBD2819785.1 chitinase [Xenorhabdus sp. 42]MBD2826603.1 chitinase [Xenorhabdus sp. 5]
MSEFTKKDNATERSYQLDDFDPAKETKSYSYTSARVANHFYNHYDTKGKPKVFGYWTDWSQYDGRLDNPEADQDNRGRGVDLAQLDPLAFDKLIIGFAGILGDKGEKKQDITKAAPHFGRTKLGEVTFLDAWGDAQSSRNNAVQGGQIHMPQDFYQDKVLGVFGGLREKQKDAKKAGHDLILSFSIGGWTMSDGFFHASRDPERRINFSNSVVDLFKRFPMFTELDLDWEYPGAKGNENHYAEDDWVYYELLIKELKSELKTSGLGHVKISIATSADPKVMALAHIPELISAGVEGINLMTYDFFGTPWAEKISHHTNLYKTPNTDFGVDAAVDYLLEHNIDPQIINIGYAGYTRNGRNTTIEQISPLIGSYSPEEETSTTTGTFESGTNEWYDIIYNYLDLKNKSGKNGFELYTDEEADADYLYSSHSHLFMSLDTPRTIKAKGAYALEKGLGGIFTWTADQDNGLLVNAAREGLGCKVKKPVIDMQSLYFKGKNVAHSPIDVVITGPTILDSGTKASLSGKKSSDPEGLHLTYFWKTPENVDTGPIDEDQISFTAPVVNSDQTLTFTLTVTNIHGLSSSQSHTLTVKALTHYLTWDPKKNYSSGDRVSWEGSNWEAKWWTHGIKPGTEEIEGQQAYPWKKLDR